MRKGLILFLVFTFLLELGATTRIKFYPDLSVYSEINDYEYYRVNSYFVQTAYLFNRMYGLEFPEYRLEVLIDDKASGNVIKKGKSPNTIVIITNRKLLFTNTQNFEKVLIKAFLLAGISIPIDKCKNSDIEWVISGTLREINRQRNPSLIYPDFPIVNRIVQNKGRLDYQEIIAFDITEKNGVLYDCFTEECQILADAILKKKNGREFIFEYIKSICSQSKNDRIVIFSGLLKKYQVYFGLSKEKVFASFNEYLNKTAAELAINLKIPLSTNKTEDEFSKVIVFKDKVTGKEVYINAFAGYLKDRKDRNFIIQEEKNRVSHFAYSINILLVKPVQNMIALLDKLENDKDYSEVDYKSAMDEQIKYFYDAVSRVEQIEKYLYDIESKNINIGKKYNLYLLELEGQSEPISRSWPELQKFLDANYPAGIN